MQKSSSDLSRNIASSNDIPATSTQATVSNSAMSSQTPIPIATGNIFPATGGVRREMITITASTNTRPERIVELKYSNVKVVGEFFLL